MKKLTLKLCFLSLCMLMVGLSSCSNGKLNRVAVLAVNKTGQEFTVCEHSNVKSSLNFKGKCNHVDKKIPWNECDKCGLHKVYW